MAAFPGSKSGSILNLFSLDFAEFTHNMADPATSRHYKPTFEEPPFLDRRYDEDISIKQILTRSETLLQDLRVQRDTETSRQVELLKAIKDELASEKTPLHLISNAFFQWLLVATGFIFGLFAIQGTNYQGQANFQSLMQNQMNLVEFCQAYNSSIYAHPCEEILQNSPSTIAWLANQAFPNSSLGAEWPWNFDNLAMFKTPWGWYNWIIAPAVTGLLTVLFTWWVYQKKFGQKNAGILQSSNSGSDIKAC
ncbi:hypothetical protein N431DRAFT_544363 [Stipitochalara longipes BDJ]|nr:hypothetical protein N431DRAFT_544363 [Stipitochalara longipes BDJ]